MRHTDRNDFTELSPIEAMTIDGGGPTNCIGTYDEEGNLIGTCTDPSGVLSQLLGGGRPY